MRSITRGLGPSILLALLLAGAGLISADPAAAQGPTSVDIQGRGNGHGHGMSQWGAQGAALQGRTTPQILAFYYPGTSWGTAGGNVTVQISGDTSNDVVVANRTGLTARRVAGGTTWKLRNSRAKRWRLAAVDHGASTRLSVLTDRWHVVRTLKGQAQFGAGGAPIKLFLPHGSRSYRGVLRSAGGSARDTVNVVSLESYLKGVVPQEAYPSWEPAALRAQAVAARTYAAFERSEPTSPSFQMYDDTRDQAYGGYSAEVASTNAAVSQTAKQVLTYAGEPAFTQFSASNGGWTTYGGKPYLPAQQDPYDSWAGNPWPATIQASAIERALPAIGDFQSLSVVARDGNGMWGGRVTSVRIDGLKNGVATHATITGDQFRSWFGLRSTWWQLV
ncbi:SpoIID/LytB domain-containing protein [Nocardioides montaniterrae]